MSVKNYWFILTLKLLKNNNVEKYKLPDYLLTQYKQLTIDFIVKKYE